MTPSNLCDYIKGYLEHDQTRSAIMLNGGWGTGKSYFIQHELVPFLKNRCITISLYGLKNVTEISKSIYFDSRFKPSLFKGEGAKASSLLATTVIKGVTSFLGVDLSLDVSKLEDLYSSIDLSGKLIILEDVERTEIALPLLMGYVNNLVDHDGVKVLLVANEIELKSEEYYRIKEKTISNTLSFNSDYTNAMKNILMQFGDDFLSSVADDAHIKAICEKTILIYVLSCLHVKQQSISSIILNPFSQPLPLMMQSIYFIVF